MSTSIRVWILTFLTLLGAAGSVPNTAAQEPGADRFAERKGDDVVSTVASRTTILHISPEGSRVKKGELVCLLDPSALQNRLANQSLIILGAKAAWDNARMTREEAEIAVTDYVEGTFKPELQALQDAIARAEADLKRAEDRFEWSSRMLDKGYVPKAQNLSDKFSLDQKVFAYEQTLTKKNVLDKFTKDKTVKELQSEIEKARSVESARHAAYARERDEGERLKGEVERCKVFAPADGRVTFTRSSAVGAVVHKGQFLFRVVPEHLPDAEPK